MTSTSRKFTLQCIGVLLTLISLLIAWMFFTTSGSSSTLNILGSKLTNLEYEYKSGTLASGLYLEQVKWQLENKTVISAPNLKFSWNPKCWNAKEVCISEMAIDQLVIDVADSDQETTVTNLSPVDLPVSIIADSLLANEVIINKAGDSPMSFSDVNFSGRLEGSMLEITRLKLDWLWLQADFHGTMTLNKDYPIDAKGTLISTDPSMTLPIRSSWRLGGDLLSMQLDADFNAPYPGELSGTYSMLRAGLPANIKITWPTAPWPRQDDEPQIFVDNGELLITGTGPDYKTKATAVLYGNNIPASDITLDGRINSRKATFFPMTFLTLGGSLDAEGVFKWHNGLSWNASLEAKELWPDLYWPQVKGLLNGTASFSGRSHNDQTRLELKSINSTGILHGHKFTLTGDATKDPYGVWHLSSMQAVNKDSQIYANGTIGVESELKLLFNSQSIHKFFDDMFGDVHGDVLITGDLHKPNISGAVSSANLKIGDIKLRNVKTRGILTSAGLQKSKVTTVAERVTAHSEEFLNAKIDLNGSLANHTIKLAFDHKQSKANQVLVEGQLEDSTNWRGQVKNAHGLLSDRPIALRKSFDTRWIHANRSLILEPHCWTMDLAEGCITNNAMIGENGRINFSVNSLDLDGLNSLQSGPLKISGILNAKGELNWGNSETPSVLLTGEIDNASASLTDPDNNEKVNLALNTARIDVATKQNLIETNLQLKANKFGAVNVQFNIDTDSPAYPVNGSLALSNSDVTWLRAYLPDNTSLAGHLSADGIISGNLEAPRINGVARFNKGSVASPSLPVELEDITLDIEFSNNESRIIGSAQSSGTPIAITGTASQISDSWSSNVNVRADNLKIDTDFIRNAIVSPDLDILVADAGVRIDGDLVVHKANIVVNDLGAGGIATSSDVVIIDASDNENENERLAATKQNFASEIDVSFGRRVKFSGYGLKAELRGDFHLALDDNRPPELLGEIEVDNGTYRSYGQNLLIRDGRITFIGPLEQTAVTVEAVREVDNILAGLRVDGSLKNPTTTLFSEPALPKEEILSYVVLGRSLEFGSTDDTQILTNAALFLGISNGRSFSQNIAESLGIEDFYLTATGTGDETQVMLSGRLNNRLLVRYGVGVFNAVSTLFLRYDLAEQLYIETTQGLERAIDIFYSFEF